MFLSVSYSELIGRGVWHLFILIPHFYIQHLPGNMHDKKFCTHQISTRKDFAHEIPARQKLGATKPWWHDGTRTTMTQDPQNSAHLFSILF